MPKLILKGREVEDVFDLVGEDENAITAAIAYVLSRSKPLLVLFLDAALGKRPPTMPGELLLQQHEGASGTTDLELYSPGAFHVIVEAKRGWVLPQLAQLRKYAARRSFAHSSRVPRRIITLGSCSSSYANQHLPPSIKGIPVRHVSWRLLGRLADKASRTGQARERRLTREFAHYLARITTMQDRHSNLVYVVALSLETPRGWRISWKDVVAKRGVYFHPVGPGWPKEPPTYIGFRYGGQLQSIHFISGYKVIEDLHSACKEIPSRRVAPSFLYKLGPAIRPPKPVKTGGIYRNGRVWCALDLLLTCATVSEARQLTEKRMQKS